MLLNVDVSGKTAVVIGGGAVATRKTALLLSAGAVVHIVAPVITEELKTLDFNSRLILTLDEYHDKYLEWAFLVVAATNSAVVNRLVSEDAGRLGKLVCVADVSKSGNFSFPSNIRRGDLEIGVSTSGRCPALSAEIRDLLASVITEEYIPIMRRLAEEREKLLTSRSSSTYNAQILRSLARQLISELSESKDKS